MGGEPLPAWARDPARLELIFHTALRAHDTQGAGHALHLLAACAPARAETLVYLLRLALVLKDTEPTGDAP